MRAIRTCGLYIYNPIFEDYFLVFKRFLLKILSLCMVSIQERVVIKNDGMVAYMLYEIPSWINPAFD